MGDLRPLQVFRCANLAKCVQETIVFESLSGKLDSVFKNIRGQGKLTEKNMKDSLQEIRVALLEADVNYKVVKKFVADVETAAVGQKVLESIHPSQQIVKVVHDEMMKLMGGANAPLVMADKPPTVIMMVGLQGQGKTTTAGKLAVHLKKKGKKPLLVGADVYRPAAIQQLEIIAEQSGVESFSLGQNANPVDTCVMSKGEASMRGCDVIILDTAGRLHVDDQMMAEVRKIEKAMTPNEILFVANATTGQDAVNSAKQFNDVLSLSGVILTQMDGDARGGAAISLIAVTGCPIKFVGTGETLDKLEAFHPNRMADQILGMGDIVSLVEQAQEVVDHDEAVRLQKKIKKASFNLEDFLGQMQQIKKMGSLGDLMKKIPGMNQLAAKGVEVNDDDLKYVEAIIRSMTMEERRKPKIIKASRRRRIAAGSGTQIQEVDRLLKDFDKSKKLMKMMMKGGKGRGMRGRNPFGGMPGM